MIFFKYYRASFLLSFFVLLCGSMLKVSHSEIGLLNGNNTLAVGLVVSVITIALAFYMIFKSQKMAVGEKLIWVLLFSLGFIFKIGLIAFLAGLVFFFIGRRRLFF